MHADDEEDIGAIDIMNARRQDTDRLLGLAQAVRLCERLDAAEQNERTARAAWLIAQHVVHRVRQRSRRRSS